jgi:hypothetical protein
MVMMVVLAPYRQPTRSEVQRIPISLITNHTFGNPFPVPTGPTTHYTPLYPLILAAIFKLFGTGPAGDIAQYVFNTICSSAMYAALPFFAVRVGLPMQTGLIGGLIGALLPLNFMQEIGGGDMFLTADLMLAFTVVLLGAIQGELRLARAACAGVILGLGALTNPAILPPAVGLLALVGCKNLNRPMQVARFAVTTGAICFLFLLPWAARNQHVFGTPILLRGNLGMELQVSNNDIAVPRFSDNPYPAAMDLYHPFRNPKEAQKVRVLGEVAYNREKLAEYTLWVKQHTRRFWQLIGSRFILFWMPVTHRVFQTAAFFALSLAAFLGFGLLWRANRLLFWIIASVWLTYPDIYYLVQSWSRYRLPIQWSFLLCAAVLVAEVIRRAEKYTLISRIGRSRRGACQASGILGL